MYVYVIAIVVHHVCCVSYHGRPDLLHPGAVGGRAVLRWGPGGQQPHRHRSPGSQGRHVCMYVCIYEEDNSMLKLCMYVCRTERILQAGYFSLYLYRFMCMYVCMYVFTLP